MWEYVLLRIPVICKMWRELIRMIAFVDQQKITLKDKVKIIFGSYLT